MRRIIAVKRRPSEMCLCYGATDFGAILAALFWNLTTGLCFFGA